MINKKILQQQLELLSIHDLINLGKQYNLINKSTKIDNNKINIISFLLHKCSSNLSTAEHLNDKCKSLINKTINNNISTRITSKKRCRSKKTTDDLKLNKKIYKLPDIEYLTLKHIIKLCRKFKIHIPKIFKNNKKKLIKYLYNFLIDRSDLSSRIIIYLNDLIHKRNKKPGDKLSYNENNNLDYQKDDASLYKNNIHQNDEQIIKNNKDVNPTYNLKNKNCNALKGFISPDVETRGDINDGCPYFMKKDIHSKCCIFDMKHIRQKLGMRQKLTELHDMINNDNSLDDIEKNNLYIYLRTGNHKFDFEMSIELKNENHGVMDWLVRMVENFFKNIIQTASALGTAIMLFLEDILGALISISDDKTSDRSKEKNMNFLKTIASTGAGALTGGVSAALAGGNVTGILSGAVAGGVVGYLGPLRILKVAYNFAKNYIIPVFDSVQYIVRKFTADIHIITATLKVFLSIKRSLCSNLGILLKNKQLMIDYLAQKNILSVSSLIVEDTFNETSEAATIAVIRHKAGDVAENVMSSTVNMVGNIIPAFKSSPETVKQAANIVGDSARNAINVTMLKNSIKDTYQYVLMIFDVEDCEMHYTNRKLELFESIMRKEISVILENLTKENKIRVTPKQLEQQSKTEEQKQKEANEKKRRKNQATATLGAAYTGFGLGALAGYGTALATATAGVALTPVIVGSVIGGAILGGAMYLSYNQTVNKAIYGDKVESVEERRKRYYNEAKDLLHKINNHLTQNLNDFYENNEYTTFEWLDKTDESKISFFNKVKKVNVTMHILHTLKGLNYEWTRLEKLGIDKFDNIDNRDKNLDEKIIKIKKELEIYKSKKEELVQLKKVAKEQNLYDDRLDQHAESIYGNEQTLSKGFKQIFGF